MTVEVVDAELKKKPTKTREASKGRREEGKAGVMTHNHSSYTERVIQGE